MAGTFKHRHQTVVPAGGADVDRNEWNDSHVAAGGTDGQVLTRDSAQTDGWAWSTITVPPSGLVLLEEHVAAGSASLDFTTRNKNGFTGATFQSDCDQYVIECINILPATSATQFIVRFTSDGGASWDATAGHYGWAYHGVQSTPAGAANNITGATFNTTELTNIGNLPNTGAGLTGSIKFSKPLDAVNDKLAIQEWAWLHTDTNRYVLSWSAWFKVAAIANGVRGIMAAGNITSGTMRVYGIAK